jgi:hypothetical protein
MVFDQLEIHQKIPNYILVPMKKIFLLINLAFVDNFQDTFFVITGKLKNEWVWTVAKSITIETFNYEWKRVSIFNRI